jgi:hypothetical protein
VAQSPIRGTVIQTFPPTDDAVLAFEGTANLEKGVINTQGVIRSATWSRLASPSPLSAGPASTKKLTAR